MPADYDELVSQLSRVEGVRNPYALANYMRKKGITMSPELRAELEAKHRARQAAQSPKAKTGTKKRKKAGKKRRKTAKKAKVGIRTMKELDIALKLKKHGRPTVKSFRVKY